MIDKRIQQLRTGRLGRGFAPAVADRLERATVILQFKVVPVLAPDIQAAVAVLQLQPVDAGKNLGEGFAALEVEATIVRDLRLPLAAVIGTDQVVIGLGGRPAGADGQLGIDLAFDLANVKAHAPGGPGERRDKADCQRQFDLAPEPVD